MKKVIIVGGGLSGLSSAVLLAEQGIETILIEASPKLGGRTYSLNHKNQNEIIDNGQHIMMGCYKFTFEYLKKINAFDKLDFQKKMEVNFVDKKGNLFQLKSVKIFYPFNLLLGILNYRALKIRERFSIVLSFLKIFFVNPSELRNLSTKEYLGKLNQTENSIKSFWEIIHVGTLNTELKLSSAETFVRILKTMFFTGNESTKIVIPKFGLSQVFVDDVIKFLHNKKCEIHLSEKVIDLEYDQNKVVKLITNKREITDFDFVISAIPHFAIKRIDSIHKNLDENFELTYSSILTVHLWISENKFDKKFYGLIDSDIHWIFNHDTHITIVTSSADRFINIEENEIVNKFIEEIESRFSFFKKELIQDFKVIKEKRATFIPNIEIEKKRMNLKIRFENLILAGDWTNTELPATIEGTIKSGFIAVDEIINEKIY